MPKNAIYRTLVLALVLLLTALACGATPNQPARLWMPASDMASARSGSCSAMLPDGRVLVTGGADAGGPLAGVEVYGPDRAFAQVSPMLTPRQDHVCAALPDGTVVVAGGRTTGGGITSSAEKFDPATGVWSPAGAMTMARASATATLLKDGRVLIAGGLTSEVPTATLETFDPATLQFSRVGAVMSSPRGDHAAAALRDGRVLIGGGFDGSEVLATVDMFDPASGSISLAARMAVPRSGLSATSLFDGNVLFAGGSNGSEDLASAEVYLAKTGKMSPLLPMASGRRDHMAVSLPRNNSVLLLGGTSAGQALDSSELYIPWLNSFQSTDRLSIARVRATGTPLKDGGVLMVAGGKASGDKVTPTAETYSYATLTSDRGDYLPGMTVTLTGTGWLPGETVRMVLSIDPKRHKDVTLESVADADGNFVNTDYVVQKQDEGVTFYVTSTGLTSGRTAALLTFTDGSFTVTVTGSGSVTGSSPALSPATCTSSSGTCSVNLASNASYTLTASAPAIWTPTAVKSSNCPANSVTCTITMNGNSPGSVGVSFGPVLTSVSPASATYGAAATLLTVTGNAFVNGSTVINFHGLDLTTTCSGATQCTATIPAASLKVSVGTLLVYVHNGTDNSGTQNFTLNQRPITVTAATNTKGYDGTTSAAATPTITSGTLATGDIANFTEAYSNKNAGTGKTLTPAGSVTDGNSGNNYTVTFANNTTGVITARAITVTAATNSKGYDGTTSAAAVPAITSGSLASGDTANFTEAYSDKNAGSGKTLTPAGTVTDGNSGNNYAVTFANNTTGVITARAITVTAATNSKGYDGTTSAAAVPAITSGSLASGDTANFTEAYGNKSAGTNKTLIPSGSVTDGNSGNNYAVTFANDNTGVITARAITVTAATNSKEYDGTTSASAQPTITSGSLVSGDSANFTEAYGNKNAGTNKALIPSGSVTDGNGGNNYAVTFANDTTGVITARAITVTAATNSKQYDGTTSASAVPTVTSGSLASGDTGNFTEAYTDKNVGAAKALVPSGTVSDGNGGANYLVTFANGTGSISGLALTGTITADPKGYDGTRTATLSSCALSTSPLAGDTVSLVCSNPLFAAKTTGIGRTVTASLSLAGAEAGNYTVNPTASTTADIAARLVTGNLTAANKAYDGTTAATITGTSLSNAIGGDTVSLTVGSAQFANAGTGTWTVTASGLGLTGADAVNYALTSTTATTTATISGAMASCSFTGGNIGPYTGGAVGPTVNCGSLPATSYTVSSFVNPGVYTATVTLTDPNYAWGPGGQPSEQFIVNTVLVANARSGQVTLSWRAYTGAVSYTVCNLTRNDCRAGVATTAYQFTALTNNTTYSFQVTPVFAGGTVAGTISNVATATPKALVP